MTIQEYKPSSPSQTEKLVIFQSFSSECVLPRPNVRLAGARWTLELLPYGGHPDVSVCQGSKNIVETRSESTPRTTETYSVQLRPMHMCGRADSIGILHGNCRALL